MVKENGSYSCPMTTMGGAGLHCPGQLPIEGNGPTGGGAWDCTSTEFTLSCDSQSGNPPPTAEQAGCTLTQGFWKNHEEVWPVQGLDIGGTMYTKAELLEFFRTAPQGDASIILGHQLVAALLNQKSGAGAPMAVSSAIANAQSWMAANKDADGRLPYGKHSSAAEGQAAMALSSTLDDYNNGGVGPGHCK